MRKKMATMVITLLLVGALCAVEQISVAVYTDAAMARAEKILDALRAGDLDAGIEQSRSLDRTWDEWANRMELLIDHGSTDDVRYALSRLIAAMEGEDRASALIYASELEGGIEHVRERQMLTPQNLL